MKWFKMMWLNSEEREILRKAKNPVAVEPSRAVATFEDATHSYAEYDVKPYKNVLYSNRILTVVMKSGNVLSKANVDTELFQKVKKASTELEIESLMIDTSVYKAPVKEEDKDKFETQADKDLVANNLSIFNGRSDFEVRGTDVYLKGVNLAMPAPVAESFIELLEKVELSSLKHGPFNGDNTQTYSEQLHALKMFWLKLALNTIPQSREDLLTFVRKNDIRITRNGNLILYRRIVSKQGADTKLVTFITQNYYSVKKAGNDPKEYAIANGDEGYELIELAKYDGSGQKPFVNLQVAYLELPTYDNNDFTSAHDNKVSIKLGGIYSIPDSKINLDNGICAAGGLHAAAVDYNYSGFGDLPVVVLVNPSKAITVPRYETGKLRTTEMFVACVNDQPIGKHFDESALSAFDSEYHDLTLEQLEEAAKNKSFETLSVQDTVPAVSLIDLNAIKDMLRARISLI